MTASRRRAKGDGSLRFREDKKLWTAQFDVGRRADGKRVRRTLYAKTRAELQRKIADLKARGGGSIVPRAKGTVGDFVERWLAEDVRPNLSPNTFALYSGVWKNHAAPIVAGRSLEKFDIENVVGLYAALRERGVSASMIRRVGGMLRNVFEVAIRRRLYARANPFDAIDRPTHRAKKGVSLTVDQARRFVKAAHADRFEALWVLLLTGGLRLGEALALRWSDIDFDAGTVSVNRNLLEVAGKLSFGEVKTSGSRRLVVLGQMARQALLRRLAAYDAEGHGSELAFSTPDGTPVLRSNLRRRHFAPVLKAAKIKELRIHDLRHSMTSLGVAAGLQAKVLADRLGHSTTRLTEDRYAHVLPGIDGGAAAAIDDLLIG